MDKKSKLCIANDHAGYELKVKLIDYIKDKGFEIDDLGCFSPESVDYTEFAYKAAKSVSDGEYDYGIIICGTGLGVSIAANKVKGIRAAVCTDSFMAKMCREHNDANIMCMGARVIGLGVAKTCVDAFLETEFDGGRHKQRVDNIMKIEKDEF